jgi:hypothetical protein
MFFMAADRNICPRFLAPEIIALPCDRERKPALAWNPDGSSLPPTLDMASGRSIVTPPIAFTILSKPFEFQTNDIRDIDSKV